MRPPAMNEPFIIDDESDVRRSDGICLTGWEDVIFELEDEPGYDAVFGSSEARTAAVGAWKPIFECVPSQNGFIVEPPQRQSARFAIGMGLPFMSVSVKSPSTM